MLALVDCNNFYASCERLFRPELLHRPVVVLSNNDGCVIARSDEAKALGIEMGTPEFMMRELIREHGVVVFSSNYALYGDISDRVMVRLSSFSPGIEVYSIDEAFLGFEDFRHQDLSDIGRQIQRTIHQEIGIPVSIGMAPTKTLAKMANRFAKKNKLGVFLVGDDATRINLLKCTAVGDIWGVGGQYLKLLTRYGFKTAYSLSQAPDEFMRKHMTVGGQRLLSELNGIPAIEWELQTAVKKNICTARGFGKLLTERKDIEEALATYTASCAEKLRQQGSACNRIQVFVQTNSHRKEDKQYYRSINMQLSVATSNTGVLIKYAMRALDLIFVKGYNYQKCGILVMDLVPAGSVQRSLFEQSDPSDRDKLMDAVDDLNRSLGKDLVRVARQGFARTFKLRQAFLSKRFTTRLEEILEIKI